MEKVTVGDYHISKEDAKQLFDVLFPFITERERNTKINEIWAKKPLNSNTSIRLSYGPKSKQFEKSFSSIHGCKYGVLSNSGTSSLQVALQALKEVHNWEDGAEVIVPATTFVATANIVLHNNLKPVFIDVDKDNYGLDISLLEKAITPKTRCIIPVHLFGISNSIEDIKIVLSKINRLDDIKIIEDACEAAFSTSGKQQIRVGSMGDIGCFSFYVAHTLTTGIGGMAITDNPIYAEYMRSLVNHGWDRVVRPVDISEYDFDEIKKRYNFSKVGHSFRVSELEAALGLGQLETYQESLNKRYLNVKAIIAKLKPLADRGLLQLPPSIPSLMMFPIVCLKEDKWELIKYLEKNGVEIREMLPLINQPIYADLLKQDDFPVSQMLIKRGLYIGCHHFMEADDIDKIGSVFNEYFGGTV